MEPGITWYDVLGVLPGAETGRIRTEVSTRLVTGITSVPRTSQLGTECFSTGLREPPRMSCWTGSP
jgi:hypothetical protein